MNKGGLRKLTAESAVAIWNYRGSMTYKQIGEKYGVSKATIYDIWYRRRWASVTEGLELPGKAIAHIEQKLTSDDARLIFKCKGEIPCKDMAEKFEVSTDAIYNIWRGNTWREATKELRAE